MPLRKMLETKSLSSCSSAVMYSCHPFESCREWQVSGVLWWNTAEGYHFSVRGSSSSHVDWYGRHAASELYIIVLYLPSMPVVNQIWTQTIYEVTMVVVRVSEINGACLWVYVFPRLTRFTQGYIRLSDTLHGNNSLYKEMQTSLSPRTNTENINL